MPVSRTRTLVAIVAALLAAVLLASCSSSTPSERTITLTFIRHAESDANASGIIDTSVPGPSLTPTGQQQAAAVQRMYASGNNKPVAFSSAASIMMWTLMNARNAKNSLATDHPLPNTGRVVLTGNPVIGWTLVDWDGITAF